MTTLVFGRNAEQMDPARADIIELGMKNHSLRAIIRATNSATLSFSDLAAAAEGYDLEPLANNLNRILDNLEQLLDNGLTSYSLGEIKYGVQEARSALRNFKEYIFSHHLDNPRLRSGIRDLFHDFETIDWNVGIVGLALDD